MAGPDFYFLHLSFISSWLRALTAFMGCRRVPELLRLFPADSMPLGRPSTLHQSPVRTPPFTHSRAQASMSGHLHCSRGSRLILLFRTKALWWAFPGRMPPPIVVFADLFCVRSLIALTRLTVTPVINSLTPLLSRLLYTYSCPATSRPKKGKGKKWANPYCNQSINPLVWGECIALALLPVM